MREDTKVRPYKNSFTLSLFQREGILGAVYMGHFEEKGSGDLKRRSEKKYTLAG